MTEISERNAQPLPSPLAGLKPSRLRGDSEMPGSRDRSRLSRSMLSTVPIVLVGSMAVASLGLTGPIEDTKAKGSPEPKLEETAEHGGSTVAAKPSKRALSAALASANAAANPVAAPVAGEITVAEVAPSTYRVQGGDTVSSIAGRFGLSTASVLALNGLGWKSVIFPGQVLKLTNAVTSAPAPVAATSPSSSTQRYTIGTGDTVSSIATKFGVSVQAILSANGLGWSSVIYPGRTLTIPSAGPAQVAETVAAVTPIASTTVTENYTIKSGDTLSGIATKFGVSVASLLSANNLSMSSIIFGGQNLKVPRSAPIVVASTPATEIVVTEATATSVTPLSAEMEANATTIVRVGQQLGVSDYGIVIALAAAMQESSLRNVNYGDRDSLGLFQQRPSTGWGTPEQLLSPEYASRLFYGGRTNPNAGTTLGLLDISGWESMSVTDAAQKVQISAYPNAYAKWETSARAWLAALK
jgi:LysM repeat protein